MYLALTFMYQGFYCGTGEKLISGSQNILESTYTHIYLKNGYYQLKKKWNWQEQYKSTL